MPRTSFKAPNRSVRVVRSPSNETHVEPVPITLQYRNMQITSDKFNCNLSFVTSEVLQHVYLPEQKLTMSRVPQKHAVFKGKKGNLT